MEKNAQGDNAQFICSFKLFKWKPLAPSLLLTVLAMSALHRQSSISWMSTTLRLQKKDASDNNCIIHLCDKVFCLC